MNPELGTQTMKIITVLISSGLLVYSGYLLRDVSAKSKISISLPRATELQRSQWYKHSVQVFREMLAIACLASFAVAFLYVLVMGIG